MLRLLVAGVMIGTLYGLVAVTLTLMLRSSGVLSFAHAGFALIGAYSYTGLVCPKDPVTFRPCGDAILSPIPAAALAVGFAVIGALLVERLVARPLVHAPPATKLIATAAVLGLVSGLVLQIFGFIPRAVPPQASRHLLPLGTFEVGNLVIAKPNFAIFLISITLVSILGVALHRSWFGLGVRAAGQLPDVARLMGVSPVAVSRFNWALGGLLAGLAGVFIGPITILNPGTFSFLLTKAVGAVLIGGLVSLPFTFLGGIAIGAIEGVVPYFWTTPGAQQVAVAVLVLSMLLVHRKRFLHMGYVGPTGEARSGSGVTIALAQAICALRAATARVPRALWIAVGVPLLVLVPLHNAYYASVAVGGLYYCMVALSVLVLTGTTGQVTFMQAGFAAVGAFGLATASYAHWNLLVALVAVVVVCSATGVVIGRLSLRFRGLEFAIASVALGAVLSEFVVTRHGVKPNLVDPELFGRTLLDAKNLFLLLLAVTAVAMLLVANMRRSYWGRTLTTMREMHTHVGHFGVSPMRSEVSLLAVSAGLAGLAGAFLALIVSSLDPFLFVPLVSVTFVLVAVVGGLRSLWGPVVAGLVFGPGQEIVGRVFSRESANAFPQIASALLALVLILAMPNGLASVFTWARALVRSRGEPTEASFRGKPVPGLPLARPAWAANGTDAARRLPVGGRTTTNGVTAMASQHGTATST